MSLDNTNGNYSPPATIPTITSGFYQPTSSAEVNIDGLIAFDRATYLRVDNVVTVSGQLSMAIDTALLQTTFEITLPVGAVFSMQGQLSGVINCGESASMSGSIKANITNHTAEISIIPPDFLNNTWTYVFTYRLT